ncbi:MAG: hypothetical protein GY793_07740 [Proteobacteria bacterium]|nr:hypothetical protein [Pseudomonadota bacterium]
MGSIFSQPKSPAQPPLTSYKDEIGGVEQVPVTNADGSVTYVTRALPLSAEDAAKKRELENIQKQSLEEIQKLSDPNYVFGEQTQTLLDGVRDGKEENLNSSFTSRKQQESDYLAKRGLDDSTAGTNVRRQTKQDEYNANKQIDREMSLLGNDIRSRELVNQYGLYGLAQDANNYDIAKKQSSISSGMSMIGSINSSNYASVNDYYNRYLKVSENHQDLGLGVLNALV